MPPRSSRCSAASRKKQQPSLLLSIPTTATTAVKSLATNNGRYQLCLPPIAVHRSLSLVDYSPRPTKKAWENSLFPAKPMTVSVDAAPTVDER
ncbi:hypothetical protein COP1_036592 [Malus domestica]